MEVQVKDMSPKHIDLSIDSNNILEYVYLNARMQPEMYAVEDENGKLTYRKLIIYIDRIANGLKQMGIKEGDRVLIKMPKSINYILCMLAVLRLNATYIPLDDKVPSRRMVEYLNIAEVDLAIVNNIDESIMQDKRVKSYEQIKKEDGLDYNYRKSQFKNDAYIIFTSGSTGEPKGIRIKHKSLINLIKGLNERIYNEYFDYKKVAVDASFGFDSSIKQIYYALVNGQCLVIPNDNVKEFGRRFFAFIAEKAVNVIDITPSFIDILYIEKRYHISDCIEKILIGGEVLSEEQVNKARAIFGDEVELYNMYGPSECCVDVSAYKVEKKDFTYSKGIVPIGKPLIDNEFSIENEQLVIHGKNVGIGYLDGFMFENETYYSGDQVYRDEDGNYIVTGRSDNQVKINGHRIELQEVKNVIEKVEGVETAVLIVNKQNGRKRLFAYVKSNIEMKALWETLEKRIPSYMLPSKIIMVDKIMLTKNGKIDTKYYEAYQ